MSSRSSRRGYKAGNKTFKVHIDGYNLLPFLKGEVKENPRKGFLYWSDDGDLMALRVGNWKCHVHGAAWGGFFGVDPTMDHALGEPKPSMTIDQVPLDWCFQPGVKLDFRHFASGYVATAQDVEAELARIGHALKPLEIVLVNTAAGAKYGDADYVDFGCGMGREATLYLTERGVRVTGIDGWSWDAPFSFTAQRYAKDHDPSIIWEGHKAGRDIGYCHLEKLHNLEELPSDGFMVSCFPVKVKGGSAGWTRAVAIFED